MASFQYCLHKQAGQRRGEESRGEKERAEERRVIGEEKWPMVNETDTQQISLELTVLEGQGSQ